MKDKNLIEKIQFEAGQITEGIILGTGKVVTAIEDAAVDLTEDILDTVKEHGIEEAVTHFTEIEKGSRIFDEIIKNYHELEEKIEKNRISSKE